jgi:hypothetical protein
MSPRTWRTPAVVLTFGLMTAVPALAGPPLLCHPFDIATARSLPWSDTRSWLSASDTYRTQSLVTDVEALLVPSTPVLVRMETLRRAAIYATRDPEAAARLFTALDRKAREGELTGRSRALALLDAAYYTEALRQASQLDREPRFRSGAEALRAIVRDVDGYVLAAKGLALGGDDPAFQFEAALIALGRHADAYPLHAEKARAGVARDALLARNIEHVH